jgi:hypothetical protein
MLLNSCVTGGTTLEDSALVELMDSVSCLISTRGVVEVLLLLPFASCENLSAVVLLREARVTHFLSYHCVVIVRLQKKQRGFQSGGCRIFSCPRLNLLNFTLLFRFHRLSKVNEVI